MQLDENLSPLALAGVAAALGWWVGLASAWHSDRLVQLDDPRQKNDGRRLVREPLVQGGVAAAWALLVLSGGLTWPVAAAGLLAVALIQVGVTDLRHGCVYTLVAGCGLVVSMLLSPVVTPRVRGLVLAVQRSG
jgi:hypothetical protein